MVSVLKWMRYDVLKNTWTSPQTIDNVTTSGSPSLAYWSQNDELYCGYPGPTDDTLHWTSYDEDRDTWANESKVNRRIGSWTYNLAAHLGDLCYLRARLDTDPTWRMQLAYSPDGESWEDEQPAPESGDWRPAVAAVNARLHCVHTSEQKLWWTYTDDGKNWSPSTRFPDSFPEPGHAPAVTEFDNTLYCVYSTMNSSAMRFCRLDNGKWTSLPEITNAPTDTISALAGTALGRLMCVYYDFNNKGTLGWTCYESKSNKWTQPTEFPGINNVQEDVALARYLDNVYCVYPASQ